MIYLILIIFVCFYIALLIWIFRPEYVLCGIIKDDKRCDKCRSVPKLFNASELCVLNKIIYNTPILGEYTHANIEAIKNAGFNINLPVYKIDLAGHKSLKLLSVQLKILRRLESVGYPTNIVINFDGRKKSNSDIIRNNLEGLDSERPPRTKDFFYNDILILTSGMNFEKSVIKIHQAEFLGSTLMFAVNALNINKDCVASVANDREGVCFEVGSKVLDCGKEFYDDFVYKSSVFFGDINITKKRTASFKRGYTIERFAISNLGKGNKEVKLNIFLGLGVSKNEACYIKVAPYKGGVKFIDYKNKIERYLNTSCGLLRNLNVTKLGIKGQITAKIRGGSVFYVYVLSGSEGISIPNLECGEELFFEAKNEYKVLSPLKVQSDNLSFDRLINLLLPQKIVGRFIDSPASMSDFNKFTSLISDSKNSYVNSLKGMYVKNDNLIGSYFDLLWQFVGVSFLEHGIKMNPQRRWMLKHIVLKFQTVEGWVTLKIQNDGNEQGFVYNGVEYCNINFLPYKVLIQNSNALISM